MTTQTEPDSEHLVIAFQAFCKVLESHLSAIADSNVTRNHPERQGYERELRAMFPSIPAVMKATNKLKKITHS